MAVCCFVGRTELPGTMGKELSNLINWLNSDLRWYNILSIYTVSNGAPSTYQSIFFLSMF